MRKFKIGQFIKHKDYDTYVAQVADINLYSNNYTLKWIKHLYKDLNGVEEVVSETWSDVMDSKYEVIEEPRDSIIHKWKEYIGFTDRYKYCECCGKKE